MKKSIILSMLAMATAALAYAAPVTPERAGDIAVAYGKAQYGSPASVAVKNVEKYGDALYLVHFSPKGFAFVSADDCAYPVLGYSFEGNFSANNVPDNMGYILTQASDIIKLEASNGSKNALWSQIEDGYAARISRGGEPVSQLIQVEWNQGSPYNKYCPGEGSNKAVVGCVAVAMSQAMSVQQYPLQPQGQASYNSVNYGQLSIDFDKEAPYDWDAILNGKNNENETARLLYHAGVAVSMDYASDGSGIPSNQVYRITNALKNNFGYTSDVQYYWRDNYSGDWEQLLLNELYAGRAMVYNAIDTKGGYGHSFNIDGYDGTFYHLNWGWGGYGNGYFSINNLADAAMNMNYDSNHVVVVGIGGLNSPLKSIQLSDLAIEEGLPAGSPVSMITVNGERPSSSMKIEVTGEYNNVTGSFKEIPLTYKDGLLITAREITAADGEFYVRIVATVKVDGKDVKLIQGYMMNVEAPKSIEAKTSMKYDRATQMFYVHSKFGASYTIKNSQGAVVASGHLLDSPTFEFSRALLTAGDNTLEISIDGKSKTVKLSF